jgi:hypothetical protein
MDEFAYFHGTDVSMLILLLMLWVCAVVAIDHWVSASRSESPARRQTWAPWA